MTISGPTVLTGNLITWSLLSSLPVGATFNSTNGTENKQYKHTIKLFCVFFSIPLGSIRWPAPTGSSSAIQITISATNLFSSATVSYWLSVTPSYDCQVTPFVRSAATPSPISITGFCRFTANSQPAGAVSGAILISRFDGTQRYVLITSDYGTGAFSYIFYPSSNEAGTYSVSSYHPATPNQIVRANFTLSGWRLPTTYVSSSGLIGIGQSMTATIQNIGNTPLSGLSWVLKEK